MKEHICIISPGYPTEGNPYYTFVDQLVCALADMGIRCTVIAPQSATKILLKRAPKNPKKWVKLTKHGNEVNIYQPLMYTISDIRVFNYDIGETFFELTFEKAVRPVFNSLQDKPNILYGHFWNCGIIAAKIAYENKLPAFVATGECDIKILEKNKDTKTKAIIDSIKGVISVSSENKEESIKLGLVDENKVSVIPNAIDHDRFYKMNKSEMRKELGFSKDDFIVIFVGWFIERKGPQRVAEALRELSGVKSIFIGSGEQYPNCENILFCGRVAHENVAKYLNCADVFVLPTLAEGCCNSIIEAMACSLPIVSSDLSCNDDILKQEYSIRVDPTNIKQIAEAIYYIKEHPFERIKMSEAALIAAGEFTIEERARKIWSFMVSKLLEDKNEN